MVSKRIMYTKALQIYSTKEVRAWLNQPLWKCLIERLRSRMLWTYRPKCVTQFHHIQSQ